MRKKINIYFLQQPLNQKSVEHNHGTEKMRQNYGVRFSGNGIINDFSSGTTECQAI